MQCCLLESCIASKPLASYLCITTSNHCRGNASLDTVKVLLDHTAQVSPVNKRGLTPLGEAAAAGNVEVAKLLVAKGAILSERPRGFSLLHVAAGMGQEAMVHWLLSCGANPNGGYGSLIAST